MSKFKFRLETVEKVRKQAEMLQLKNLSEAQRKLQAEIERKMDLLKRLDLSLDRREKMGQKSEINPQEYQIENLNITGLKKHIEQADRLIKKARRGVDLAFEMYLKARKNKKSIEVLKEKAYQNYKKELMDKENKSFDDLMLMRARFKGDEA